MQTLQDLIYHLEDHGHVVAGPEPVLEEEGGAVAAQRARRHDGLAVGQDVGLIHEVGCQEDHLALLPVLQHGPQMPGEEERIRRVTGKLPNHSRRQKSSHYHNQLLDRFKFELPSNETCVYHVKLTIIHKGRFMRT